MRGLWLGLRPNHAHIIDRRSFQEAWLLHHTPSVPSRKFDEEVLRIVVARQTSASPPFGPRPLGVAIGLARRPPAIAKPPEAIPATEAQ